MQSASATLIHQSMVLSSGHRLGFAEFGNPQGFVVFYCHGFPSSRLEGRLYDAAAASSNVRLIVVDRPGYGLSDPKPLPSIADWTDELAEFTDYLGIDKFRILGVSGGGPYALACADRLTKRLISVGVVGGLGPVFDQWALKDMKWPARVGFSLARQRSWFLHVVYGELSASIMRWKPRICQKLLTVSAPEPDRKVLANDKVLSAFLDSTREALRHGARGVIADFHRYASPWGFDLANINITVNLWHGNDDRVVPSSHALYLNDTLAKTRARFLPHEGHFSLPINHMEDILKQLTLE